ncbi:MAG TPA: glycosyltransferase family 2 protein [Tissierellaceae bacterium]
MQNSNSNIKVSVCVVTYNQEKYIGECLESLVTQKTDFPFEIIVGDDASTDNTPNIILEYQQKYPDIIIPVLRQENLGPVGNTVDIYKRARGQYVAHLDGDDMALPGKLQIQANILDENPDCMICSHDVLLWNGKLTAKTFRKKESGIYTLLDLYQQLPFFAHSSKMFRNNQEQNFWDQFSETALDVTVHVAQAKMGYIYHIQNTFGIYREQIGIAIIHKRINPIIPSEVEKIYIGALEDQIFDKELIQKLYAKAFFEFAYQSAIYMKKDDLKTYMQKSFLVKKYSILQICMYALSQFPTIFCVLSKLRKKYLNGRIRK